MTITYRRSFVLALCCACLLASKLSLACEPSPFPAEETIDYAQGRVPYGVVFTGTVSAVQKVNSDQSYLDRYEITFTQTRWLRGGKFNLVIVEGWVYNKSSLAPCGPPVDFLPKMGEQWLIFGQLFKGNVGANVHQSQRMDNGRLPANVEATLRKQGFSL